MGTRSEEVTGGINEQGHGQAQVWKGKIKQMYEQQDKQKQAGFSEWRGEASHSLGYSRERLMAQ